MITTQTLLQNPELRKGAGWRAAVTHCPRGHEYTPENTRRNEIGGRECKACRYAASKVRLREWRRRRRREGVAGC
jgi:hypothetical protein